MSLSALRPVLLKDAAGTLIFAPPEGTPTSGTVKVYDENGTITSIDGAAATVSGSTLTRAITAAILDTAAENYRAEWTYVVSSTTYVRDQLFDCARQVPLAPLSETEFLERYPILSSRLPRNTSTFAAIRAQAWERVCQRLALAGKKWRLVIDTMEFLAAQAHFAAAISFSNLSVGPDGDAWQARAAAAFREAEEEILARLANPGWYDADEDRGPDAGETHVPTSIEITR